MGIKKLLPKLDGAVVDIVVSELEGCTVGIDASCWLYQVLYPCSWDLFTQQPTHRYVTFFEESIKVLVANGVHPIVVFDGQPLPAKAATQKERKMKRDQARKRANDAIYQKKLDIAEKEAKNTVEITADILKNIMMSLRGMKVPFIQAPYEADAQLAYMTKAGVIEYIITEDSDLLVYGAAKVIYKWDRRDGSGKLIENISIPDCVSFDFTPERFAIFCVLCGCDYLKSLPNVGIARAETFMTAVEDKDDIYQEISNMGRILNTVNIIVPDEYVEAVKKAVHVFHHQIVFDFGADCKCPYSPYPAYGNVYPDIAGVMTDEPLLQHMLDSIWATPQELDISRRSDTSWLPEGAANGDDEEPRSHYLRTTGSIYNITSVTQTIQWTVPDLPVLTLVLLIGITDEGIEVAVNLPNNNDPPKRPPFSIFCSESCDIVVNTCKYLLLWKWESIPILHTSDEESVTSTTNSTGETSSEGMGDDTVMMLEEEVDDDVEHTAGFKVMGVTKTIQRQDQLLEAKLQMSMGRVVGAILKPEPSNPRDPNAIQIVLSVGNNICCVGYIARELTQYIHPVLQSNKVVKVSIVHIRFRAFQPAGYYMKLNITRKGRWHPEVIRKSLRAK